MFKKFLKEEKGQTMVEWIVILALIVIVVIVAITAIGKSAKKKAEEIDGALQ